MGYCKKDVTPLLTHWSYVFLALPYQFVLDDHHGSSLSWCALSSLCDWTLHVWSRAWPVLTWFAKLVHVAVSYSIQRHFSQHPKPWMASVGWYFISHMIWTHGTKRPYIQRARDVSVVFLYRTHESHYIARLRGRGTECHLWVQSLTKVLLL